MTVKEVSRDEWRLLSAQFQDNNHCQSWEYASLLCERQGARSIMAAIEDGGRLIGCAGIRVKTVPVVGGGIALVSGGPLTRRDDADMNGLGACLVALREELVGRRGLVLRVQPSLGPQAWNEAVPRTFTEAGFAHPGSAKGYRTLVVDVTREPEAIRQGFTKDWRDNLKRSEKRGLTVRIGGDAESFGAAAAMYAELSKRKGFHAELDVEFFSRLRSAIGNDDQIAVVAVEGEGEIQCAHVVCFVGDTAVYVVGASSPLGLKNRASFLVDWASIVECRRRGMRFYDTGGIDPDNNPKVYHYKSGLGGQDVLVPGPFECAPAGLKSRLTLAGERLYRSLRGR